MAEQGILLITKHTEKITVKGLESTGFCLRFAHLVIVTIFVQQLKASEHDASLKSFLRQESRLSSMFGILKIVIYVKLCLRMS